MGFDPILYEVLPEVGEIDLDQPIKLIEPELELFKVLFEHVTETVSRWEKEQKKNSIKQKNS